MRASFAFGTNRHRSVFSGGLALSAVPRVNHLLRTVSPGQALTPARRPDQRVLQAFGRLLGLGTDADTAPGHGIPRAIWERQGQLPEDVGGCGLRSTARTSPATFWVVFGVI
jgi:hypothetical protein